MCATLSTNCGIAGGRAAPRTVMTIIVGARSIGKRLGVPHR